MSRSPAGAQEPSPALSYEETGVDSTGAARGLTGLIHSLRRTLSLRAPGQDGQVLLDFGHYANVIRVGGTGLAVSTDGVGSKILIAEALERYDTLGIDLIAMNVNDLLCVGAEPLCMVDYIAMRKLSDSILAEIGVGLLRGAEAAGITIPAGELAQLPDMITGARPDQGLDLVGTALGVVDPERLVTGVGIRAGDVVIGFASSGLHSNGFSLVRRVLLDRARLRLDQEIPELERTLGEELLEPTVIYVKPAVEVLKAGAVHGMAHITGGGFTNLLRLHPRMSYVFPDPLAPPPIFQLIAARGPVSPAEMITVFNMGIGLMVVVPAASADRVRAAAARHGLAARVLGEAVEDGNREIRLPAARLRVTEDGATDLG
jgi:phosphoribosylformylglycinamidine cyclo-ligase